MILLYDNKFRQNIAKSQEQGIDIMKPEIIYEDSELIVCIKPAGIATQSKRIGSPDMVSILKNHIAHNTKSKQPPYLAVIHRLDQPVTGLLVFAKTPFAAKELNHQLQSEGFGKYYRTWLSGCLPSNEGDCIDYLVKDGRTNTSSVCEPDTPGAKKAELHYKVLQQKDAFTLAEITLKTGRHHQIRVQMSNLGCPIVGDRKYGTAEDPSSDFHGLQLFACRLTLKHPRTHKQLEFLLPETYYALNL